MKIAYLALGESWNAPNAGFSHSYSICKSLAKQGMKVELAIRGKGTEPKQENKNLEVKFINLPKISKPLAFTEAGREIKKIKKILEGKGLVHERYSVNPLSLKARESFKGKVVLEVNDPGIETWSGAKRIAFAPLIKKKLESCNAIITQTETLKKILEKQTEKPIFVVSNGADIVKVSQKEIKLKRKEMKLKKREIAVTFAGNFREWHGVHLIPEIAKKLERNNKVKFFLIGGGVMFNEVKEKCEELKLKNTVFLWTKSFKEIPDYLKASDILIAPFTLEKNTQLQKFGFWWSPLKLFEYLVAGKPIVTFDFEEVRKIVGKNNFTERENDLHEFANAIEKLAENKLLRQEIGRENLKKARQNSWEKRAIETIKIYEKVSGWEN